MPSLALIRIGKRVLMEHLQHCPCIQRKGLHCMSTTAADRCRVSAVGAASRSSYNTDKVLYAYASQSQTKYCMPMHRKAQPTFCCYRPNCLDYISSGIGVADVSPRGLHDLDATRLNPPASGIAGFHSPRLL